MNSIFDIINLAVSVLGVMIASFLTWYIFKKEPSQMYLKDRYEKIVFPIFSKLEVFLFSEDISPELMAAHEECKHIIKNNEMLAGGKLKYLFSLNLNQKNFLSLSKEIDKEYDATCKTLGIPVRTLRQKIELLEHCPKIYFLMARLKIAIPVWVVFGILYISFIVYCQFLKQ